MSRGQLNSESREADEGWRSHTSVERGPEKAGVGGSIPSLATMFSKTYRPSRAQVGSNWFQFQIQACQSLSPNGMGQSVPAPNKPHTGGS